jgi:hypothetical protein
MYDQTINIVKTSETLSAQTLNKWHLY